MHEQMLEQQSQQLSYEAVSLTCEVSDEALEAAGGALGPVPFVTALPAACGTSQRLGCFDSMPVGADPTGAGDCLPAPG